jgi:hypothetical protein
MTAKRSDARKRACVAIDIQQPSDTTLVRVKDSGIIIFLSIGEEVKPVHLTDPDSYIFSIPFEYYRYRGDIDYYY